jgi:hypothetical protein
MMPHHQAQAMIIIATTARHLKTSKRKKGKQKRKKGKRTNNSYCLFP